MKKLVIAQIAKSGKYNGKRQKIVIDLKNMSATLSLHSQVKLN